MKDCCLNCKFSHVMEREEKNEYTETGLTLIKTLVCRRHSPSLAANISTSARMIADAIKETGGVYQQSDLADLLESAFPIICRWGDCNKYEDFWCGDYVRGQDTPCENTDDFDCDKCKFKKLEI